MVRGRSQEEVGRLFSGSTNIYIVSTCTTWKMSTKGNQITVVAFQSVQLAQASFLQKNQTLQCFFYICNAEIAQSLSSLQKSESLKLIILIFHVKKLNK